MPVVSRIWKINGKRPLAPAPIASYAAEYDLPLDWHGLANGITIPRGVNWGTAHFLVPEDQLSGLQAGSVDITCEHENGTTTWKKWYVESFEAVTKQGTPAYWVRLADPRLLLANSGSDTNGMRFNYRKSETEYVEETAFSLSSGWTWQQVLNILWDFLPSGAAGSAPSLPYSPTTTPENLCFDGMSVWRAINQVLTAIGCSVVYNPFSGTFSYVDLRVEQPGLTALISSLKSSGRLLFDDHAGGGEYAIPQLASCIFHLMPDDDGSDQAPFQSAPHIVESSIGGPQGKYPILDTMWYYPGRSMTARANEIGTSLAGLLDPRENTFGATYAGIVDQAPGSRLTSVRWISDGARGMQTMLFYEPEAIDWPKIPLFYEQAQGDILATFTFDGPTHGTSGTFGIVDQITFTFDDFETLAGNSPTLPIVVNEFNLIALTGDIGLVAYRASSEEWLLIDVYPAKTRRFYFELSADWPDGLDETSTNATLIYTASTHSGGNTNWSSITLRDRFNLASNAKATSDIGICELNYKTGQFDILEISHVCWRGRGDLYATFSDTPATFQVENVIGFDGRAPDADPLTVYNELNIPAMATGDPVEIRWNTIEGHYYAMPPAVEVNYIRYFELAEDANVTGRAYIYAYPALLNETTSDLTRDESIETPFKLYQWQLILGSPNYAKAGYTGIYSTDDQGRSVFINGPCIGGCQADGTIDLDLPAGEVGTAYSHTVTGTDIDDTTIDASNLPDGLTFDSVLNEINGTPTVAGTFLVVLTATSNNACTITNIMEVVITEAP